MINIVVPMAGRGSRFANAGFETPKPLIPVGGKPMIQWVVDNIRPACEHRFIFICLKDHLEQYPEVESVLRRAGDNTVIIPIEGVTEGPACTVLLAKEYINNSDALMIANSDQYVDCDINAYLDQMEIDNADGLIMTFKANDPKWSFCRMRQDGTVSEVIEKEVISDVATVGIYNYKQGRYFVEAAKGMIADNFRVNCEFYVAPAYNWMIRSGKKVAVHSIGENQRGMYGLGVPEDLEAFQKTNLYKELV